MSMRPVNLAPSARPTRGAKMLPCTRAVSRTVTDSSPWMSPSTVPSMITMRARMLPLTPPSVPIVRLRVCSIEPSSWPWISRSSSACELALEAQRRTQHRGDGLLLRRSGRFGLGKRGGKPRIDGGCVHLCLLMIRDCARFNARRGRRDLRVRFATSQPQLLQELARSVGIPFRLRH